YRHLDLALDAFKRPTQRLARVLARLYREYDYVFLDCPPSISLVSESVFEAADALLVPIIPATLSSRTFEQLDELLDGGRSGGGADGPLILAFFSIVDRRKRLHREVMERLRSQWSGVLETAIPASAEIERMGLERDIVASYARRGGAALAYETLWEDVRRRLGEYPSRPA